MVENPYLRLLFGMLLATGILAVLALQGHWVPKGEWVGWIQAVGSVAAIFASIFIAQAEHWNGTHKEEVAEKREADALVLELVPQLHLFRSWIRHRKSEIEAINTNRDPNRVFEVSVNLLIPPIPRGLRDNSSARLLLLGREDGLRAIQIREVSQFVHDAYPAIRNQTFKFSGKNVKDLPQSLIGMMNNVLSLETITERLITDLNKRHDELIRPHEQTELTAELKDTPAVRDVPQESTE
jgi:hypothetical protein